MSLRKIVWVVLVATACAPTIAFAQNDSSGDRATVPKRASIVNAQHRIVVVIGASTGLGLSYLPLTIMEEHRLLEKHAARWGSTLP